MRKSFKAYEVFENQDGHYEGRIVSKDINDLPEGDVTIQVHYSSLNYKDALSYIGNKGVTTSYPHVPGIDAAGIVVASGNDQFKVGQKVIVTGYDLGMNTSGGFGDHIRVPASWVVKCPKELTLRESMIYGTAGFTAALSVKGIIESGIKPEDGDILVTGATGGVASTAIMILSQLGYQVYASTGKSEKKAFLQTIGAQDIVLRSELQEASKRPLLKSRWAGVIDTVGGASLANALKAVHYNGCVTCCGNVGGHDFMASIYPFILRGLTLKGIDSVMVNQETRQEIWQKLSSEWYVINKENQINEVPLSEIQGQIELMLKGKHIGRTIIKHDA